MTPKVDAVALNRNTATKSELTPEQKALIESRKGLVAESSAFDAAQVVKHVIYNIFSQAASTPIAKPANENAAAMVVSSTTAPIPQPTTRPDPLQTALVGKDSGNKTSENKDYSFGLDANESGSNSKWKKEDGNTYSVAGKNWRENQYWIDGSIFAAKAS